MPRSIYTRSSSRQTDADKRDPSARESQACTRACERPTDRRTQHNGASHDLEDPPGGVPPVFPDT